MSRRNSPTSNDIDCFAEAISRTLDDEEVAKEFSRDDVERAFAKKAELINLRSSIRFRKL